MSSEIATRPIMTAKELLELNITEIPMLVEGLMQQTGLVGITGSSDVGKSTFLRQLALSIASGESHFLNFPLHTRSNKVIYVSTEDMMTDIAVLIRKQLRNPQVIDDCWNNLIFITETQNLRGNLDSLMEQHSPDCVIIDAFTDIHTGDNNMSTSVRAPLNKFKNLAQKHHSLFVVLNHIGKRAESNLPSKHNSLGSQGFEAKMRMLAEIRLDKTDDSLRHFCIVKGNYIPNDQKKNSYVLKMDPETLLFKDTGERVLYEYLGSNRSSMRDNWMPRCCEIKAENPDMTLDNIYNQVIEEGFTGSRATIWNYLQLCEET